jgi:hypothetical protein
MAVFLYVDNTMAEAAGPYVKNGPETIQNKAENLAG